MIRPRACLALVAAGSLFASGVVSLTPARSGPLFLDPAHPVVVELFTSQSCYSCPPAEAYLGELAGQPGILALEWHVDYWNDINYRSAGRWEDPFSNIANTQRQVAYNQALRGTGNVYTPQMIVAGRYEAVGSRTGDVEAAIRQAVASAGAEPTVVISADIASLAIAVDGPADGSAEVWLVRFITERTTQVLRGENHGQALTNHHVVTGLASLGVWSGGPMDFTAAYPAAGEGCAILVQPATLTPVLAAAACPIAPPS